MVELLQRSPDPPRGFRHGFALRPADHHSRHGRDPARQSTTTSRRRVRVAT
jgi:hypothetical protein